MHDPGGLVVRPPAGPLRPSLPPLFARIDARAVAEIGRAATILLPVFWLTALHAPNVAALLFTVSIVTATWYVTLRSAFGAVPFTLGPAVPAFVGTLTGLVVVSAGNFWVPIPGTRMTLSTLTLMKRPGAASSLPSVACS
jgi:hypothetical protein